MIRYSLIAIGILFGVILTVPLHAEEASSDTPSDNGIISFSGEIVEQTCLINGHVLGSDFVVQLPSVKSSHLKRAGQRDGDTEFSIQLSGCSQSGSGVRAKFMGADMHQNRARRFALSPSEQHPDMAKNVMIEVDDKVPNTTATDMVFHPIDEHGNAQIAYVARYYAMSPVEAGKVHTRVIYVLEYQ